MAGANIVTVKGTAPQGEVWSSGFAVGDAAGAVTDDVAELQEWCTAVAALWSDANTNEWSATLANMLAAGWAISSLRIDARASATETTAAAEAAISIPGSLPSGVLPRQTAVVASLRTARVGRSYRGRMYWPAPSAALEADTLRFSTQYCTDFGNAISDMFSATTAAAPTEAAFPMVWSRKTNTVEAVTLIEVGDVPDTQRRRRDRLTEARVAIPIA